MEIKNKLTMIRQKERGITGERRERGKSKNVHKESRDKDNGVGIVFENGDWIGKGRATWGSGENCN